MLKKSSLLLVWVSLLSSSCASTIYCRELHWDWDKIKIDTLSFPKSFKFGVASSEYQVSGNHCFYTGEKRKDCPASNWSRFEQVRDENCHPLIKPVGKGVNHWHQYKEDVQLIKQLGVTVYRCSIDWARVQPREGYFDSVALQHYHALFDELKANKIEVMVTLHHFVNPVWFEDKGAFEKEKNIQFFVAFAKRIFTEFKHKVSYWCTINEPGIYAAQTYITNHFPRPYYSDLGFPCNLQRGMCLYGAALVTKHLMLAHILVYKAIKALPGGTTAQVGLVHNIVQFESYHPKNLLEKWAARFLGHVYCDAITRFLITGKLRLETYLSSVKFCYPAIKQVQDFVGLNYYSHVVINWRDLSQPAIRPEDKEIRTDMYYGMYPEGIYRAIKRIAHIGKPIYITENGLADAHDTYRELWYKRYLYAVNKAIQEGADVRMFCAWSLLDNYEWNLGFDKQFGLYKVDRATHKRTLKNGARYFQKLALHQKANSAKL